MISTIRNIDFTENTVKELKELILMVKQKDESDECSDYDRVNRILDLHNQYLNRISDYHKLNVLTNRYSNSIPGFIHLVRESVLTHEWTNAVKITHAVVNEAHKVANTLWKVGLTSLILEKKPKVVDQYVRHLYKVYGLTCTEVLLDYLLYLLVIGDLERAEELLQESKSYYVFVRNEKKSTVRDDAKILFSGYMGFTQYVKWKTQIVQEEMDMKDRESDFIKSMLSQGSSGVKSSKLTSLTALDHFACIKGKPGVWDIFIIKMIEIYEYYDDLATARKLLTDYRKENPCNPNAHHYLFKFDKKHEIDTEDTIQILTSIVKSDPSSPLAFELYEELELDDPPQSISVLFDYLDFDHCKDDIHAWELLMEHMSTLHKDKSTNNFEEERKRAKECWLARKDWWPSSTLQTNDNDSSDKLSKYKTTVHGYLKDFESWTDDSTKL